MLLFDCKIRIVYLMSMYLLFMVNIVFFFIFFIGIELFGFDEILIFIFFMSFFSCFWMLCVCFMEWCCMKFLKYYWVEYLVFIY